MKETQMSTLMEDDIKRWTAKRKAAGSTVVSIRGQNSNMGEPLQAAWHRRVAPQAQRVQCAIQTAGAVPSGPGAAFEPPGRGSLRHPQSQPSSGLATPSRSMRRGGSFGQETRAPQHEGRTKLPRAFKHGRRQFGAGSARRERAIARGGRVPKKIASLDPVEEISCAEKARLITGLRHHHKLKYLLQVAVLARSTFYYQCQSSQRADKQRAMEARIRAVYDEHKGRYGYRRITAALCSSMAKPVNHKCVQRLMQKMGLRALIRTRKRSRHVPGMSDVYVPNILQRDFCATAPNQKWV